MGDPKYHDHRHHHHIPHHPHVTGIWKQVRGDRQCYRDYQEVEIALGGENLPVETTIPDSVCKLFWSFMSTPCRHTIRLDDFRKRIVPNENISSVDLRWLSLQMLFLRLSTKFSLVLKMWCSSTIMPREFFLTTSQTSSGVFLICVQYLNSTRVHYTPNLQPPRVLLLLKKTSHFGPKFWIFFRFHEMTLFFIVFFSAQVFKWK